MKTTQRFLPLIAGGSALIAAVLQTLSYLFYYTEPEAHYFRAGALLPILSTAFAIFAVVLGTVWALLLPKKAEPVPIDRFPLAFLPCALGFFASGVFFLPTELLAAVLLLLGGVFALLLCFPFGARSVNLTALFGFLAILSIIYLNGVFYFDASLEMNAPLKTSVQVASLSGMVYLTGELRALLKISMPRTYRALGFLVIGTSALTAIPVPVAFLCGKTERIDFLAGAILSIGFLLTAAIRLWTIGSTGKNEPEPQNKPEQNEQNEVNR